MCEDALARYYTCMTLDVISPDDQLLVAKLEKIEALTQDPDQELTAVPFCFTMEETEAMARLWKRGLIEPVSDCSASLTPTGIDTARRLRD